MKTIYSIFATLLLSVLMVACQSEDEMANVGYLRLDVEALSVTNPQGRAVPEDYNPRQLAVQVLVKGTSTVVQETDDHSLWAGKALRLAPGSYTIKVSSAGFDGMSSGFDAPYYAGQADATVTAGTEVTVPITCTQANVKVTVKFDETFVAAFRSATATVSSLMDGVDAQVFTMGQQNKSAYFPVADLKSLISVVNHAGVANSRTDRITGVQARDHYILNYKTAEVGTQGGVTVTVDGTETIYNFFFPVSTEARTGLAVKDVNAWSTFAYAEGIISALEAGKTLDDTKMSFKYKPATAEEWSTVSATKEGETFKATLPALTPNTTYECRLTYEDGTESYASAVKSFTTETANKIPNLSFEGWIQNGKHWYPNVSMNGAEPTFWDSGNEGANTIGEKNPTRPEETIAVSGKSAKLFSLTTAGQFAAGSLFTGNFGAASLSPLGATLDFGRSFTERPSQLTGYYRYSTGTVTHTKVSNMIKDETRDSCSIYVLLSDWETPFAVSTGDNILVDFDDSAIIAHGELSKAEACPAENMTEFKKFTIDLKYRSLTRKPKHILIVCSSSKYGDFFTGSTSSVLYLDEFDLIYGEPVVDTRYITQ